jgi:hypothetical protein
MQTNIIAGVTRNFERWRAQGGGYPQSAVPPKKIEPFGKPTTRALRTKRPRGFALAFIETFVTYCKMVPEVALQLTELKFGAYDRPAVRA